MTLAELVALVQEGLRNPDASVARIETELDNALLFVAQAVRLRALKTSATVTTISGQAYVALPEGYHRDLFSARDVANQKDLPVFFEKQRLSDYYSGLDNQGSLQAVCVEGMFLFYQPIPMTATQIAIEYYAKPTSFTVSAAAASVIPVQLQRILVHYVCWRLFGELEDALDGGKPNTVDQWNAFSGALNDLRIAEENAPKPKFPCRKTRGGYI